MLRLAGFANEALRVPCDCSRTPAASRMSTARWPSNLGALEVLTEAVDHVTVGSDGRWSGRGETSVAAVDRVG